jgi:hypothetical protein
LLVDAYPVKLVPFTAVVDQTLKTVLFAVTLGQLKQISSNASSAYEGLIALKRHCSETSTMEKHLER